MTAEAPTGPTLRSLALATLGLAGAYILLGRLGLQLAIPPGYVTAIWPPAGLALAASVAWNRRAAPGIFLGSFLLNLWIADLGRLGLGRAALIAACIALASTLQAWVGGTTIRRVVPSPSPLDQGPDILAFFLLGGPVACVIAPALGVFTLVLLAGMPPALILQNAATWWAGDTLGAMAFAPLALAFLGEPRAVWRRRRITLGIPLILTFLAVVLVFTQVRALERERMTHALGQRSQDVADRLQRTLDQHQQLLEGLQAFCEVDGAPDRARFHRYASQVRSSHESVQALEWAPVVSGSEREALEARVRAEGFAGFAIRSPAPDGALSPSPPADRHVPLLYLEPFSGNQAALGLDLYADPTRQRALDAAAAKGALQASPPLHLVQHRQGQLSVSLALPVHAPGGRLTGFVLEVFRFADTWVQAFGDTAKANDGLHFQVSDTTDPARPQGLLAVTARHGQWVPEPGEAPIASPELRWSQRLTLGGRTWTLEAQPALEALTGQGSWEAWATLAAGGVFCTLMGALLLATTARAHYIEEQVEHQTSTLRHREASLSQATRLLDQSQAAAGVGGWELDLETGTLYWTAETYRLHGVTPGPFHPTWARALSFIAPAWQATVEAAFQRCRDTGEPWSLELELLDGPLSRWIEFTGRAELHEGRPTKLYGSYQDITHRREADQLKNDFISVVSHELRTPLTALKGSLGLIRAAQAQGDFTRFEELMEIAERNNERLDNLVADLLDMEKVRSGRLDLAMETLDLQTLVDHTLQETESYATRLGVRLVQEARAECLRVQGDPQRLSQVLANLVSNAAKFSPPGGRVRVGTYPKPGGRVRVNVSDEGPGIPEGFRIRIFQPFAQADSSDRRAKGGTGLGLSISKALIERMGGEIGFTTLEGKGTTFWFELPVTDV